MQGNMSVSDLQVYSAETNAAMNKAVEVTASGSGSNLEALSGAGTGCNSVVAVPVHGCLPIRQPVERPPCSHDSCDG